MYVQTRSKLMYKEQGGIRTSVAASSMYKGPNRGQRTNNNMREQNMRNTYQFVGKDEDIVIIWYVPLPQGETTTISLLYTSHPK